MKHTEIKKRILSYLDGELSEDEAAAFRRHLQQCPDCQKQLDLFAKLWQAQGAFERPRPSPFLWTRIEARIDQYERNQNLFTDFFERLIWLVRPVFALLMLAGGIFLGIYLGNVPASSNTQSANVQSSAQDKERFFNSIYLDSFQDLPPESVGGVYVTLASSEAGR